MILKTSFKSCEEKALVILLLPPKWDRSLPYVGGEGRDRNDAGLYSSLASPSMRLLDCTVNDRAERLLPKQLSIMEFRRDFLLFPKMFRDEPDFITEEWRRPCEGLGATVVVVEAVVAIKEFRLGRRDTSIRGPESGSTCVSLEFRLEVPNNIILFYFSSIVLSEDRESCESRREEDAKVLLFVSRMDKHARNKWWGACKCISCNWSLGPRIDSADEIPPSLRLLESMVQ